MKFRNDRLHDVREQMRRHAKRLEKILKDAAGYIEWNAAAKLGDVRLGIAILANSISDEECETNYKNVYRCLLEELLNEAGACRITKEGYYYPTSARTKAWCEELVSMGVMVDMKKIGSSEGVSHRGAYIFRRGK